MENNFNLSKWAAHGLMLWTWYQLQMIQMNCLYVALTIKTGTGHFGFHSAILWCNEQTSCSWTHFWEIFHFGSIKGFLEAYKLCCQRIRKKCMGAIFQTYGTTPFNNTKLTQLLIQNHPILFYLCFLSVKMCNASDLSPRHNAL